MFKETCEINSEQTLSTNKNIPNHFSFWQSAHWVAILNEIEMYIVVLVTGLSWNQQKKPNKGIYKRNKLRMNIWYAQIV